MTTADLPEPLEATFFDLPPVVAAAAVVAPASEAGSTRAKGVDWAWLAWGEPGARPLLLVHGVTSCALTFWRIGPALAAAGWRCFAVDLPGHGRTRRWAGRHRFRDTATDVVGFARAAGLARADGADEDPASGLVVVGHSWGAMITAAFPVAGLRAARLVLLDPPVVPQAGMAAMVDDPVERHYDDLDEAVRIVGAVNPTWERRDVLAKATGLHLVDETAARAILLDNGDWDGGLADLREPAAAGLSVRVIRGDPAAGSLTPDEALPAFAAVIGAGSILTVAGGPHSPQRTHPAATIAALLRALSD